MEIVKYLRERQELAVLEAEIAEAEAYFQPRLATLRGKDHDEYGELLYDYISAVEEPRSAINAILHQRLMRKARFHGVVIPTTTEHAEFWEQSKFDGTWTLTAEGRQHVRREIALERDNLWRPVWHGLPILISVISLVVSFFAVVSS
ncbi:MAG: hypothetical protein IBJ07_12340 [Rhizobiaceae bacterium]|nr:hypothetical protein [Rhizobiaceae bacterium]